MLNLHHETARSLRNALRANAIFSGVSGLLIVLFHNQVLQWLGLGEVNLLAVGAGLVLFSVYLFWMSNRQNLPRSLVSGVIAGDWAWVLGSVVLLVFKAGIFSSLGVFLIAEVALVVMVFAIWQQRGLTQTMAAG